MREVMENPADFTGDGYEAEDLRLLAHEQAWERLDAERLMATSPFVLGQFLSRLDVDNMRRVLRLIPLDYASEAVAEMDHEAAAELVEAMREARAVRLLEGLDMDDSADIMAEMEHADRERLLGSISPEDAATLRELIAYEPDSAGGIMNPEVATVTPEMTVLQTVRHIQKLSDEIEHIPYVYVTDKERKLLGVVSMRDLVFAGASDKISSIMNRDLHDLCTVDMDQEEAARIMADSNLNCLPVVNDRQQLVGIITHDDVLDVIRAEATEDFQKIVGAGGDETINDGVSESVKRRFPWLVVNLITAGLAGGVVALFEEQIEALAVLAVCMPVVANLGGNTGAQTLAIVIRSLALDELQPGDARAVFTRETLKGLLNGLLIGVLAALAVTLYQGDFRIGLVVLAAMILSMAYAGAAGAIIPILLKRLNLDPAQSSSIFVTATTDIFGFAVFLSMASVFIAS